jgi:hypothetical protein
MCSEIQDILTFSITTAEQSLYESNPQMVQKLQEGRQKRIKQCERNYQGRLKDLEQRSVATCLVSSTALEGFKEKAAKKLVEAEADIKKAVAVMTGLLVVPG